MNIRCRQIERCYYMQKRPDIMALFKEKESDLFSQIVFIPYDKWDEAKAEYGDRIKDFFKDR